MLETHIRQGALRIAVGSLVMQGCTGGTFISRDMPAINQWVDYEGVYMLVNFDRIPFQPDGPPEWDQSLDEYISLSERERESWWCWNDFLPSTQTSRPPWWNIKTKEDAKVCSGSRHYHLFSESASIPQLDVHAYSLGFTLLPGQSPCPDSRFQRFLC